MDIWILDWQFEKIALVQNFTAFNWAERYSNEGDFKLSYPENEFNREDVKVGRYLYHDDSEYLMIIDDIVKTSDDDDQQIIEVTGKSFETMLRQRGVTPTSVSTPWVRSNMSPGDIAADLVRRICVDGTGAREDDVIPGLSWSQPDSGTFTIDIEIERTKYLYDIVKELCDSDGLGFRITFDINTKTFNFKIYRGVDRSSSGLSHPMVFSTEYDNLHNTRYLKSQTEYKNTAYVVHPNRDTLVVVNRPGSATRTGINRRILMVRADQMLDPTEEALVRLGQRELFEHNYQNIFDGEARLTDNMNYGEHYHLGDWVEFRGEDDVSTKVRIDEHIWSYDSTGLRSYPTFTANEEI